MDSRLSRLSFPGCLQLCGCNGPWGSGPRSRILISALSDPHFDAPFPGFGRISVEDAASFISICQAALCSLLARSFTPTGNKVDRLLGAGLSAVTLFEVDI